ncbi:FtsX-like permease family protein [Pedobacter sp. HMF7647]|uniref:FtsX-like permease family protein n=1 Tax=Hufsiella arboris TaxID=2695275 RepID=A0A7K1YE15_9SPHI|nr:ABC transporter permease [Hufsiella arboris]MXV52650.1 FtsX-like permease family protein [Hufsiella arboris]
MLKNYFKIALRNIRKNKVFSAINIIGLAVGMAACIVIFLFVSYEKSFDSFHTKNIYRLNEVQKFPGMLASQKVALSMYPMGPTIKSEFPEIKNFSRVKWDDKYQITYKDERLFLPQVFAVDSTFLELFDFPLLKGDRKTALNKPNSILLTHKTAEKLFGKTDPMGKTITHYGTDTVSFIVTGVLANVPQNSQLQFDGIYSFSSIYKSWMYSWGGNWLNTYFDLKEGTDAAALEKKFPAYLKRHLNGDGWKFYELFLLPFKEVHANSADIGLDYLNHQKFDKKTTSLFTIIACIVLAIACINFMNLSTARSADRAREVGVRKSIGAFRLQLVVQFLGETIILSLIGLVLAVGLVALVLPYINQLSERSLKLSLNDPSFILIALSGAVVVGVFSGIYPSLFLSAVKPAKVLKGSIDTGKGKSTLRNVLVIGQFASAIFLMIATIFVVRQLLYMKQQDPGFSRDQVVIITLDGMTSRNYDRLKQEFQGNSMVSGVTGSIDNLGSHLDQTGVQFKYKDNPLREMATTQLVVDHDYLNLYGIKLISGKNFSADKNANGREYIINEALAKELLKDHPKATVNSLIGQRFGGDSTGTITGVAKNFNFNSLHYPIETMFMVNRSDWGFRYMSVKIRGGKANDALSMMKSKWAAINPEFPFEYQFLDDHFEEVYRADNQVSKIVGLLAGLAIFISCLGLFGLASFSAEKRVKEIGVRKVLGASVENIVMMLAGNFIKLVMIANIIAWPLAWMAVNKWLQGFAYRIEVSWLVFGFIALLSVFIALVTISFQSIKAAIANPVKSLRSE